LERALIIGGGIAGLTCLNALLEEGVEASLYEAGLIGSPKMCGEFVSPQAVALLIKWGLTSIMTIPTVEFYTPKKQIQQHLHTAAGAVSRSVAEQFLAERARKLGGKIFENTRISKITPPSPLQSFYRLQVAEKEIKAQTVFFATGKFHSQEVNIKQQYLGIKMHLPSSPTQSNLEMFIAKNAYLGILPVSKDMSNLACLIKQNKDEPFSLSIFLKKMMIQHPSLASSLQQVDLKNQFYLQVPTPGFGFRKVPNWRNSFWIGDALASLQPAMGAGFAHAMGSAIAAVHDYMQESSLQCTQYRTRLQRKLWLGKYLHFCMLTPAMSDSMLELARYPKVGNLLQSLYLSHL